MITTSPVGLRDDWYQAHSSFNGVTYVEFEATRHSAFMAVLRKLANSGALTW